MRCFLLCLYATCGFTRWAEGAFKLMILHNNDMHSRFDETDSMGSECNEQQAAQKHCYGGFARVKQAVSEAREEARLLNMSSIFLNAGDTFQGTAYFTFFKARVTAPLVNMLGIDAMSLGNHEFDEGIDTLSEYLNNITNVPNVAANVDITMEPSLEIPNLTPSTILDANGTKVGIIGYLTPNTKMLSNTGNVVIKEEIGSITEEANRLRRAGVRIIIALGHSGLEKDMEIAAKVPHISVVVGGHTNSFLYTPKDHPPSVELPVANYPMIITQKSGRKVAVVQSFAYTKYLGKLIATFDENGDLLEATGNNLLLNADVKRDSEIQNVVNTWKEKIADIINKEIGRTTVVLKGKEKECKYQECNLGNFVADSYVDYVAERYAGTEGWTDAPIGIVQQGCLRVSLDKRSIQGRVTYGDMLSLHPFMNPLYKVTITGETLLAIMEHSVKSYVKDSLDYEGGEFLHVSGLSVTYNYHRPAGKRVKYLKARCGDCPVPQYYTVTKSALYTLVVPKYLMEGGNGYDFFAKDSLRKEALHVTDTNATAAYLSKLKVVYPGVEGRIKVLVPPHLGNVAISLSPFSLAAILAFGLFAIIFVFIFP